MQWLIQQTRPEATQRVLARAAAGSVGDPEQLTKKEISVGANRYGINFKATFKLVHGKLLAILTPADGEKQLTHLRTNFWLEDRKASRHIKEIKSTPIYFPKQA